MYRLLLIIMLLFAPAVGAQTLSRVTLSGGVTIGIPQYTPEQYFTMVGTSITAYDVAGGTDVRIPPSIGGVAVEQIADFVFNYKAITDLVLPDSITVIGAGTFMLNQLTSLTIPNSVTIIGANAFSDNQLTSIVIPSNVILVDAIAFANNQITTVTLPDNCTIKSNVFASNAVVHVYIGTGVAIFNDASMGVNGAGFKTAYATYGAGEYVYDSGWQFVLTD